MTEELARSKNLSFSTRAKDETKETKDNIKKIEEDEIMTKKLNKLISKMNFRKSFNEIEKERDVDKTRFDSTFLIR